MAKFDFRLQSYLNLKSKLEEQKKLAYGRAVAELERERQRQLALERERRALVGGLRERIAERVDPLDIKRYNDYIDLMKKRIIRQKETVARLETAAEQKRQELVRAMQERKMLDTLKENQLETFTRGQVILEQKGVDEIVSYQYGSR